MPAPRGIQRGATRVMSLLMVAIGVAMIVSTLARGGGALALGLVLGILFVLAGAGRMYLSNRGG